jgi:TPR repeat protein
MSKERAIDLLFDPVTLARFEVRFIVQLLGEQELLQLAARLDCKDDAGRSFRILTILSEQNNARAQYQLATIYERISRLGPKSALKTAVLLYAAATEAGIDDAYTNLRELVEQRVVAERDIASAFEESNPYMR